MGKSRRTANLVSLNNIFSDKDNSKVGLGSTQPTSKLNVSGDAIVSGVITATTFSGALTGALTGTATTATNLANAANITTGTINVERLGSGASGTKFLRGDNTWQTVSGGGGGALDGLSDVTITSVQTNQVLKYDGSAWTNQADATGGGGGGGVTTGKSIAMAMVFG